MLSNPLSRASFLVSVAAPLVKREREFVRRSGCQRTVVCLHLRSKFLFLNLLS
jgi:hypothetical protein